MKYKIISEEIYSPSTFLEKMTGKKYTVKGNNDIEFIESVLDEEFGEGTFWSHNLTDIDECEGPIVLVRCYIENDHGTMDYVYRWFEVDEDYFKEAA